MQKIEKFVQKNYPTVSPTASLESLVGPLLEASRSETSTTDCLVVMGIDHRPVGLINSYLLLRAVAVGAEKKDEPAVDARMADRFQLPVSAAMAEVFPVVGLEDEIFSVLAGLGEAYFECLPVMKGSEYVGAVRTIDLFQAIADEVLSASSGGLFTDK